MVKIEYIGNTYDVDGLEGFPEITIFIQGGKPIDHLYLINNDALDMHVLPRVLKHFGIDVEVHKIEKPSKKLVKLIKEYLKKEGYSDGND